MLRALYSAASGMVAQQTNLETIANNLSNANTTGYKKARAEFQDLVYARLHPPLQPQAVGIQVGQGSRLSSIHRIFSGGSLQTTGNPYDLAIQGNGFFRVERADGSLAYTRDGAFRLDSERRLVTMNGDLVLGANGAVTVPAEAEKVEITPEGMIRYISNTEDKTVDVAGLSLAVFANPSGLMALGENLWGETDASGQASVLKPGEKEAGRLASGYLETSNVQSVEEMVNLMRAQRAYEMNSKVVQSADEMMSLANNLRRG